MWQDENGDWQEDDKNNDALGPVGDLKCMCCEEYVSLKRERKGKRTCSRVCWEMYIEKLQEDKLARARARMEAKVNRPPTYCLTCGKEIAPTRSGRPKVYCSRLCNMQHYTQRRIAAGIGTHYGFKPKGKSIVSQEAWEKLQAEKREREQARAAASEGGNSNDK